MNHNKRKRGDENDNISSPQNESKKAKIADTNETTSTNDSLDHLVFEGSDDEETVAENTPSQIELPNAMKASKADKPKERKKHRWTETEWDSLDDLEEFLDSEGFVLFDDKNLAMGQKFYFRCEIGSKHRRDL